jgi:hypothetical protein
VLRKRAWCESANVPKRDRVAVIKEELDNQRIGEAFRKQKNQPALEKIKGKR